MKTTILKLLSSSADQGSQARYRIGHGMKWLAPLSVLVAASKAVLGAVAPNELLGSCLTSDWVTTMEAELNVDSLERDEQGRLVHPFLHAARQHALFTINDLRTAAENVYGECIGTKGFKIYGVGATVDKNTGALLDRGSVNGSLIIEFNGWITHSLTSMVFAIVAREAYGIPVSILDGGDGLMTERMSSEGQGVCTPTHVNLEVWLTGNKPSLLRYASESYIAGDVGYFGRSGLYTTTEFVQDSMNTTLHPNPLYADFWKGYKFNDELISLVPVSALKNNSKFYPPSGEFCADDTMGCLNQCSKSAACTEREAQGGECMVVAMMYGGYDPGYLPASMSNIGIPTYFCFLGYDGMQEYALESAKNHTPVLFYHFEPDLFHVDNAGTFERVFLPRPLPERVALATETFGENGYGNATDNKVDVDFPTVRLVKYVTLRLQAEQPISSLASKFVLAELHLNSVMKLYKTSSEDAQIENPTFDAACQWLRSNYAVWSKWLDRLPVCTFDAHVAFTIHGCDSDEEADSFRTIEFDWNMPNPDNSSEAYNCDGGLAKLPSPLHTSRSCAWIREEQDVWNKWLQTKPACDSTFYKYNITTCNSKAKRVVQYWWLLPDPQNPSISEECAGGESLPESLSIDCDYMPTNHPAFIGVLIIDVIILGLLVIAIGFIIRYRDQPIIKRSQWEFLALVVVGGIMICIAALLYAGEPTMFLCGARPVFTAMGFTTIFGALFVKSLRVYRVFMKAAMKKATVSAALMLKVFMILVAVDVVILVAWFIVDFPKPTIANEQAKEFLGVVDRTSCLSDNFIFNALLIFWKTIVLFMGLYSSFLIRNVSSDFQESIWMFGSSVIVLIGCLVVLPLAYLVEMPAAVFYVFLAGSLLVCTALVMGMMVLPKVLRLNAVASSASSTTDQGTKGSTVSHSQVTGKYAVHASGAHAQSHMSQSEQ